MGENTEREREQFDRSGFFGVGKPFGSFRGLGKLSRLFGGRDHPSDDRTTTQTGGGDGEKGVVIEELEPDDEAYNAENNGRIGIGSGCGSRQEPSVEHPDDDDDDDASGEGDGVDANKSSEILEGKRLKSQATRFSFSTTKVTYGGVDGAYYTSTRTKRTGDDGTVLEENREADKANGQATHRVSRGIKDKGHSVTRKLNSSGKVDTFQTLHNLHEDELAGFEEAWKGTFKAPTFGWSNQFGFRDAEYEGRTNQGWALPSIQQAQETMGNRSEFGHRSNQSAARAKKVIRINIE